MLFFSLTKTLSVVAADAAPIAEVYRTYPSVVVYGEPVRIRTNFEAGLRGQWRSALLCSQPMATWVVDALMLTLDQISSDPTAGVAYYCKQAKWLVLSQYITVSTKLMLKSTVKSFNQNND